LSNHTQPNHAIAITNNNQKICFSGDGVIPEDSWNMYKDSDLLIHEAYTYDKDIPGHVKIKDLLILSKKFNIKTLALTHFKRNYLYKEWDKDKDMVINDTSLKIIIPKPMDEFDLN
jgi:ribonuclease BN (tRNA processing enzyme)